MGRRALQSKTMLGAFCRERRKELDLSVQELSARAGVTRSAIYMIERGARTRLQAETLYRLARALETPAENIFRLISPEEVSSRLAPKNGRRGRKPTAST